MAREGAAPILPSRDLRETLAFYERLGFENRGAPPEEWNYLIVGRGGIWLHFAAMPEVDPLTTAAGCYVYVDDAQALYEEWAGLVEPDRATGSRIVPPETTPYGMREFAVVDRSGNLIRVGSPVAGAAAARAGAAPPPCRRAGPPPASCGRRRLRAGARSPAARAAPPRGRTRRPGRAPPDRAPAPARGPAARR
jgi:catechol 2,3-dioxygenase-like lactoylglutathione lyase family enzyme